jgi:hypothetical protein
MHSAIDDNGNAALPPVDDIELTVLVVCVLPGSLLTSTNGDAVDDGNGVGTCTMVATLGIAVTRGVDTNAVGNATALGFFGFFAFAGATLVGAGLAKEKS